jgi:hypothetical protein
MARWDRSGSGRRTARTAIAACVAVAVGAFTATAGAAVTPTPLQTRPDVDEFSPTALAAYEAWSQSSDATPSQTNAFGIARAGGAPFRINAAGTNGYNPSAVQGTSSVIYQQAARTSNLFYFNMTTHVRSPLVAQVNSPAWEYYAVASTKYVAFMRLTSTARNLILFNKTTRAGHVIATTTKACGWCLRPTFVGASHLAYTQCSASNDTCQVRVLTIGGQTVSVPRGPVPYSNYSGSLDEATGDVYYIASTTWCGLFVSLNRWNLSGVSAPASMYDLPEGIDGSSVSLAPNATVPTDKDLVFSQYDCLTDNWDNYQIESANQIPGSADPSTGTAGLAPRTSGKPTMQMGGTAPSD